LPPYRKSPGRPSKTRGRFSFWGEYVTGFAFPRVKESPMKFRVQLVVCMEEGQAETLYEVAVLEKD